MRAELNIRTQAPETEPHTHTPTHERTHARTHARTQVRTHAHTHTTEPAENRTPKHKGHTHTPTSVWAFMGFETEAGSFRAGSYRVSGRLCGLFGRLWSLGAGS